MILCMPVSIIASFTLTSIKSPQIYNVAIFILDNCENFLFQTFAPKDTGLQNVLTSVCIYRPKWNSQRPCYAAVCYDSGWYPGEVIDLLLNGQARKMLCIPRRIKKFGEDRRSLFVGPNITLSFYYITSNICAAIFF